MASPPTECRLDIRVRYAEVDRMGAVHHGRYWTYFEMGRTELLRAAGVAYADLEAAGVFFVVARCWAKFHSPARYDEVVTLTTRVTHFGQAKIDHEYELRGPDGRLVATAGTTLACVNRDGEVIAIPDAVRAGRWRAGHGSNATTSPPRT